MFKIIIIFSILINIPIVFFFNYLSKNINLYDQPDNFRKFQKKPVALYGGLILIYNCYEISFYNEFISYFFIHSRINRNMRIFYKRLFTL